MLILSRRPGESLIIDGTIKIVCLGKNKNSKQFRYGIEAPHEVTIDREEIHERKMVEKQNMASA